MSPHRFGIEAVCLGQVEGASACCDASGTREGWTVTGAVSGEEQQRGDSRLFFLLTGHVI